MPSTSKNVIFPPIVVLDKGFYVRFTPKYVVVNNKAL